MCVHEREFDSLLLCRLWYDEVIVNKKVLGIGLIALMVVGAVVFGVYKYVNNPERKQAKESAAKKALIDKQMKSSADINSISAALNKKEYDTVVRLAKEYIASKDNLYINRLNAGVACMRAAEALSQKDAKKDCYEKAKSILSEVSNDTEKKDWEEYLKEVYENLPPKIKEGSDDNLPS